MLCKSHAGRHVILSHENVVFNIVRFTNQNESTNGEWEFESAFIRNSQIGKIRIPYSC